MYKGHSRRSLNLSEWLVYQMCTIAPCMPLMSTRNFANIRRELVMLKPNPSLAKHLYRLHVVRESSLSQTRYSRLISEATLQRSRLVCSKKSTFASKSYSVKLTTTTQTSTPSAWYIVRWECPARLPQSLCSSCASSQWSWRMPLNL